MSNAIRLESATRTVMMALRAVEAYREAAGDESPDSPAGAAEASLKDAHKALSSISRTGGEGS